MDYRHLGRSGLLVSPLCLGTMNFGWHTSEEDSFAIMDRALEQGINFFDTADVYTNWVEGGESGRSEEIVGRWHRQGGGRRDRIVLATKVYGFMPTQGEPEPNRDRRGLSALKIIRGCEASLRRLQTDCIDLYQMHHVDRTCPFDEVFEAFETLIRQGKVIYVGSSNFAGWDIATAMMTARGRHLIGLVSEQSVYNLDNRMVELEVIPACRHFGLGLIPWSPLAGGLLAGPPDATGRRANEGHAKRLAAKADQMSQFDALCRELGQPHAAVALAWLLANPVVTAPIIGPRTTAQLDAAVPAASLKLDAAALERLNTIFPGPKGEAPNAYAW